ncbi:hypothetical protein MRX96_032106 [Rhipicephalus microplus]
MNDTKNEMFLAIDSDKELSDSNEWLAHYATHNAAVVHAEATYALIKARCDQETAIKNRRNKLEENRLRFEMKGHDKEMKPKQTELQQWQAQQEAIFRLKELELQQRRQELEALEERRQEKDHADLAKSYWGLKITPGNEEQNGDDEKSIPACMGVSRHNFAYDFIHIDKASPCLTKFVNQFPFKGVGTPIVNYEYQFGGDAWLKMGPTYNAGNELLTRTHLGLPTDVVSYTTSNLSN